MVAACFLLSALNYQYRLFYCSACSDCFDYFGYFECPDYSDCSVYYRFYLLPVQFN